MNRKTTPHDKHARMLKTLRQRIAALEASLSESAQTIRALTEGEERFRIMFEAAPVGCYLSDLKGVFLDGNRAAEELVGYRKEELIGKSFLKLKILSTSDSARAAGLLRKNRLGKTTGPDTFTVNRKDGTQASIELSTVPITFRGKNVVLGIARDITDRRRAEEEQKKLQAQLIQAHKMEAVGQLAGGVAHDFNNILTAINCYGDTALSVTAEDHPVRPYINNILSLADKAAHLTQSLLAFSRKQTINLKPCGAGRVIGNVKNLLSRVLGEDIELDITDAHTEMTVMADGTQIEQVLINLAANARDAMSNGGRLTIGIAPARIDDDFIARHGYGDPGSYACISVSDTGIGMDEMTRTRIFEPFFTTKEVGKGTGLGLSIVYGVVKQHNGYITVDSEKGKGTTVRIYLPLTGSAVVPARPDTAPTVSGNGRETILLAEDDEAIRNLTKSLLERHGYTVIEASDGQEAIDKFRLHQERIHLLLTDVIMPKRDGREVYEEARTIKQDIKSLFISGYPSDIIRTKGVLEEGINFVAKPFSPKDLVRKVREVLDA